LSCIFSSLLEVFDLLFYTVIAALLLFVIYEAML